jgi:DNA-directed RNA polymerase specialized sigma24 family protein
VGHKKYPEVTDEKLLAPDEALTTLAAQDPVAARVVELRHFAGLSIEEAATALGLSRATTYRHWTYARAWQRLQREHATPGCPEKTLSSAEPHSPSPSCLFHPY